jgi:hypothetical protein
MMRGCGSAVSYMVVVAIVVAQRRLEFSIKDRLKTASAGNCAAC